MSYHFQVFRYAAISTRHLRDQDTQLLTRLAAATAESDLALYQTNINVLLQDSAGWLVNIGNDFDAEHQADLKEAGFSPEFAELIYQLACQHIDYVLLNEDGYELDEAPLFH